mmetsp:Transcript_25551/g.73743  ORF Transcript_25551/g.73743 Transcript_25551/m.73743 type:complete len:143 (-) Transcript_25551:189-617(-)
MRAAREREREAPLRCVGACEDALFPRGTRCEQGRCLSWRGGTCSTTPSTAPRTRRSAASRCPSASGSIDTAGMGFSLAADLHLLAGGGVFVGQFDSETGRIAYLRMAARLGLAPPFWHYQSTKERARAWHPFTRRPRMWAEV